MCIRENLQYICGHVSVSVTRVCPMTTQHYTYPACVNQPLQTHMMRTMCAPCERLKHSRWVLIQEWEHRWMHERGACGCETVFPGLVGPRVARPVNGEFPPEKMDNTFIPPHFRCVGTPADNNMRVEVRLNSVYGAEWNKDHEDFHRDGNCNCPVNFERYQATVPEEELTDKDHQTLERFDYLNTLDATGQADEADMVRKELGIPMYPHNTAAVHLQTTNDQLPGTTVPASRDSDKTMVGAPAIAGAPAMAGSPPIAVGNIGNNAQDAQAAQAAQAAHVADSGADTGPDTHESEPASEGVEATKEEAKTEVKYMTPRKPAGDVTYMTPAYQGALGEGPLPTTSMSFTTSSTFTHPQSSSLPSSPSYIRQPSGEFVETTGLLKVEDMEAPTNSIVGLPIGAGPEGLPYRQPHVPDFKTCGLRRRRSCN